MAEALGSSRDAQDWRPHTAPVHDTAAAAMLPGLLLAIPKAGAATTVLAGGAIVDAQAVHVGDVGDGAMTVVAIAGALTLPWRRVARRARRWASSQGAAAPAQTYRRRPR